MNQAFHVIVAMKPVNGSFTTNCMAFGTGALNIDGARVGTFQSNTPSGYDRLNKRQAQLGYRPGEYQQGTPSTPTTQGRFPANIALQDSDEVKEQFPQTGPSTGGFKLGSTGAFGASGIYGRAKGEVLRKTTGFADKGSAARFYKRFNGNPT